MFNHNTAEQHEHLHAGNILLDEHGVVKVADFKGCKQPLVQSP